MEIHEANYIHHDLHSGNIFSYNNHISRIGDLGLCQQVVDKKDNSNKIFGVIPYLAPEVLSKQKPYTKESDIYSFGMIMWEFTTGKKPFHDRSHDEYLMLDILNGERPQITEDTPEFYADLMKKCWDHNPENRPTAKEIRDCLYKYVFNVPKEKQVIIKLAEAKRQEIINSDKYLIDGKDHKELNLLNESVQQAYDHDELIDELFNLLNKLMLVDESDLSVTVINLSKKLKIIKNCSSCEEYLKNNHSDKFYKSISEIKDGLVELEKGKKKEQHIINNLHDKL